MTVLSDGTSVLGAATPRHTATTPGDDPDATLTPSDDADALVDRVRGMKVSEIGDALETGELTPAEVRYAEDQANGGRGRLGALDLASG